MALPTVTRAFRQPRPAKLIRAIALAAVALPTIVVPACTLPAGAQTAALFLSTSGGYDDNVLGRAGEASSNLPVLTEGFFQLAPGIAGSLERGSLQFVASYGYLRNTYGSAEAGTYQDHLGQVSIAWRPRPRIRLSVDGAAERFRRNVFDDFDLDRLEAAPRVAWQPHAAWSAEAGLRAGRIRYPRRVALSAEGGGDVLQTDTPFDINLSLTWRPDADRLTALGGSHLRTGSNRLDFSYDGWRGWWRGESPVGLGLRLGLEADVEKRDYDEFEIPLGAPRRLGARVNVRYEPRRDHSTLFTLSANRRISTGLGAFAELSRLNYHSNADGYSFDETRLRAGLMFRLGLRGTRTAPSPAGGAAAPAGKSGARLPPTSAGVVVGSADGEASLGPTREKGGVRFRCPAPGARQVALVGDFNSWVPDATLMSGPDAAGVWEVRIPLASGAYRYMFLVNGTEWRRPEGAALYEDDGFGMENGVLVLP